MKNVVVLAGVLLLLSGCQGKLVPITDEMLGIASEGSTNKVRYVANASVAKELAVHRTLQNRDRQIAKAAQHAGITLDYKQFTETIKIPGVELPLIMTRMFPIVTYHPMPEFNQPLPLKPSEHPAWKLGEKLVDRALFGFLGYELGSVLRAGYDAAGTKTVIQSQGGPILNSGNMSNQTITQRAGANISSGIASEPQQGANNCADGECLSPNLKSCTPIPIFGEGIYWKDKVGGCSCESFAAGKC